MFRYLFKFSIILIAALMFSAQIFAQTRFCKKPALAALKPIPPLKYECYANSRDAGDEKVSEENRRKALDLYAKTLEKLTSADWWQTDVEDLTVCDFRKKAGALSKEEQTAYEGGEYFYNLRGNRRFRAIVVRDPCYRTDFNVLNVFLLNRVDGRIFASQIIDSFTTRADFPLGFNSALNGSEPIIEIATTSGGLNPRETNYYFTIDKKTNRAVPKNMFSDEAGKITNEITSMMLLGEAEDYDLPPGSESLQIIKNGRLMRAFDIFVDSGEMTAAGENQLFTKKTLRWNGKSYE